MANGEQARVDCGVEISFIEVGRYECATKGMAHDMRSFEGIKCVPISFTRVASV